MSNYNGNFKQDINNLILEYLVMEGFKEAAEKFSLDTGLEIKSPSLTTLDKRMEIRGLILSKDFARTISKISAYWPSLFQMNPLINFKLRQLQLIELIRIGNVDEAIVFAQTYLADCVLRANTNRPLPASSLMNAVLCNSDEEDAPPSSFSSSIAYPFNSNHGQSHHDNDDATSNDNNKNKNNNSAANANSSYQIMLAEIQRTMSLLAFEAPEKSPLMYRRLLSDAHLKIVAGEVNRAILECAYYYAASKDRYSFLECVPRLTKIFTLLDLYKDIMSSPDAAIAAAVVSSGNSSANSSSAASGGGGVATTSTAASTS